MTAACREAGLPEPDLEEIGTHFRVTLSATRVRRPELDKIDQAVLAAVEIADGLSTGEVAKRIVVRASDPVAPWLPRRQGAVVEVGTGPHDPRRRYFRAQEASGAEPLGLRRSPRPCRVRRTSGQ